jgi:hypothetical protein
MTFPKTKGEKITTEGTLTLASVGQEKVQGEACRWIEMVFEPKQPGKGGATKSVFKALIPEKHLRKGGDPLGHWVKGWAKLGDQEPQRLTKEMLSNPAHMLNLLVSNPLQDTKALEKKVIETKLGKLTCTGLSGSLRLKGAAVRREDGKVTTGDVKVRVRNHFHDKAPFGVASSRMDVEYPDLKKGNNSVEAVLSWTIRCPKSGRVPRARCPTRSSFGRGQAGQRSRPGPG